MNNNQEKSFFQKINTEQNVRYALLLIIGLFGGWIASNVYSGFMIYPYISNTPNGNGDITTTVPYTTGTTTVPIGNGHFVFVAYANPPHVGKTLILGGVGSYPVTEIYFRMQIRETDGTAGTAYIDCYVKTTTGVEYGGIASVYIEAGNTVDHSFTFSISSEHYDILDWSTATATIVTG